MKMHYVIGCGGGGSWLTPALALLVGAENVIAIDGDKLEHKNLNRQLFDEGEIGNNKANALCKKYGLMDSYDEYYTFGMVSHDESDWLFVCVDNNPARLAALQACDHYGCKAIIIANETTSAESYIYNPKWKDTPLDPRVFYPELLDDESGNPMRPETCTGEAQRRNPQLVTANLSSASLGLQLYVLWGMNSHTITKDAIHLMPHQLRANISRLETIRIENKLSERKENASRKIAA